MTPQTRPARRARATRLRVLAAAALASALACTVSAEDAVTVARSDLARWTGELPVWTFGTVHPVATTAWFLDADRDVEGGEVRPGAALAPLSYGDGDLMIEDGALLVRLTGWQRADAPHLLYAAPGASVGADAGAGAVLATLGSAARDARATGAPVVLPRSGETWQPVEVQGWIAEAQLTARPDALWGLARALQSRACPDCPPAPRDPADAGAWADRLAADLAATDLPPDEARLVAAYLHASVAAEPAEGDGAALAMGQLLYDQHCWACHGDEAREGSGGDIRDSDFRTVRNAVGGYETMPRIVLAETEMRAVAAYLIALADLP